MPEYHGKLLKTTVSILKRSENFKPLLALFIADWSSTYVLSTLYELHFRKTPKKKENKNNSSDKINTLQAKNLEQSEHHIALGVIPEMDLDVIPPQKKWDEDLKHQSRLRSKTPKTSEE